MPQTQPPGHDVSDSVCTRRRLSAELIGTFALVFIGAGSVVMESHTGMSHLGLPDGKVRLVGIALAHGLTLAAMIYALGSYSGGHFNPAVSFAVWTRGKLRTDLFMSYVLAQLAGAAVAGLFLAGLFPDEISRASLGTPALAAKISLIKGGVIEATITFFLVTTVLFVTRDDNDRESRGSAGLAIGATLIAVILFAGPVTGGSANPARYLGPALAAGQLGDLAAYIIGPLIGAFAASAAFWFVTDTGRQLAGVSLSDPPQPVANNHSPVPSAATVGPAALSRRQLVDSAHMQFENGNWKQAAQALLPLLWQFDDCEREVKNRVRSLLMVIEDEAGKLELLDRYRDVVFARR